MSVSQIHPLHHVRPDLARRVLTGVMGGSHAIIDILQVMTGDRILLHSLVLPLADEGIVPM